MRLRILVVADSHDNLSAIGELLKKKNYNLSNYVIHLGDIISPFALIKFLNTKKKVIGVFGNNDGDKSKLKELCSALHDQPLRLSIGGISFTLFHGFGSSDLTRKVIYSLAKDLSVTGGKEVILYGHTHSAEVRRFQNVLVVNPGALSGYLAERKTYATIEILDNAIKASINDLVTDEILIKDVVSYE